MGFRGSAMKIRGRNRRRRGMSREWRMEDAGDVLFEVMRHLDDKSLGIAACVCRSWRVAAQEECVWEEMCAGYWPVLSSSAHLKSVVGALGGFRRLYVHCLRPLLFNNNNNQIQIQQHKRPAPSQRSRDELHLSLSLFSIDCYERLGRKGSCLPTSLHFLSRSHVKNHQPHHYHHHHIHDSSSLSPPASSFCSSSSSSSSSACPRNFACKGFSTA